MMGAEMIHEAERLVDANTICAIARDFNGKDVL
jgi:hypothetical protein